MGSHDIRSEAVARGMRRIADIASELEACAAIIRPYAPASGPEAEAMEGLERGLRAIGGAARIVEDLSASETAARGVEPFDLRAALRRALRPSSEEARARRILISDRLQEDIRIAAGSSRVERALSHLARTLVALSAQGAILAISADVGELRAHLDIASDDVPGIDTSAVGAARTGNLDRLGGRFSTVGLGVDVARALLAEEGCDLRMDLRRSIQCMGLAFVVGLPLPVLAPVPRI